jgi:hypothetical protein
MLATEPAATHYCGLLRSEPRHGFSNPFTGGTGSFSTTLARWKAGAGSNALEWENLWFQ